MMQERKLTARSVIASTLLGVRPPRLSAAVLVRAGSLFEIPEGTIRTALSQMLAVGELVVVEGRYELAGVLLARAGRQTESRTSHPSRRWDGQWRLAIVAGDRARSADDRLRVRTSLRRAHFAELREGVWTRPADRAQPEPGQGCRGSRCTPRR